MADTHTKKGYGFVYQNVMRNKTITPEAKSIYAYLASFAGNNEICYPGIELMMSELPMGRERFYKHMKILIDNGIVHKEQERNGSKFSRNIYALNSFPDATYNDLPQSENQTTENQTTENQTTENQTTELPIADTNTTNINNININSLKTNSPNSIVDTANALPTTPKFSDESFEMLCVNTIIQSCLELYPNSKVPSTYKEKEKWANEIDRMKRLDGRTEEEIRQALYFAINDSFWKQNIRSAKKLREKFETLIIQSKQKKGSGKKQTTEEFFDVGKEWLSERTGISSDIVNY